MVPLWLGTQSIPIKWESHKNILPKKRPSEPHRVQACVPETRIIFMMPKRPCAKIAKLTHTHPLTHFRRLTKEKTLLTANAKGGKTFCGHQNENNDGETDAEATQLNSTQLNSNANFKVNHAEIIWQREKERVGGKERIDGVGDGAAFQVVHLSNWKSSNSCSGQNSWVRLFRGLSNEIKISLFVNRLGYPLRHSRTHDNSSSFTSPLACTICPHIMVAANL